MIEVNNIYNIDCIEGMKSMERGSVNMVITSPPYNVGLEYNQYKDTKPYDEYLSWCKDVFTECYNVLADDGRLCINIGDGKNGSIPTHSDFIQMCKDIGFHVMTVIVWNKNNTSNRTAWGSFMMPSAPSFPRGFEYILIFNKKSKLTHKGTITINKDEFIEWSNGLWVFSGEKKANVGNFPAAFPIELPTRLIRMLTYKEDVILDPFMGSGTTAIACHRQGRPFIGFESDKDYYDFSMKRLEKEKTNI